MEGESSDAPRLLSDLSHTVPSPTSRGGEVIRAAPPHEADGSGTGGPRP